MSVVEVCSFQLLRQLLTVESSLSGKTRTGNCHFSYILIEVWSICSSIAKLISVKVANSRMSRKRAISSAAS